MKYELVSDACRVCLRKSRSCRSIYEPYDGDDLAPNEKLKLVSGVNVIYDKDLPTLPALICKSCEISLNMAFSLRNRARKSDHIVHIYLNRLNKDNIIVEMNTGRKFKLSKEITLKVVQTKKPPLPPLPPLPPPSPQERDVDFKITIGETQYDEYFMDEETKSEGYIEEKTEESICSKELNFNDIHLKDEPIVVNDTLSDFGDNNNGDAESIGDDDDASDVNQANSSKQKPNFANNDNIKEQQNSHHQMPAMLYNAAEIAKRLDASDKYEVISWKQPRNENEVPIFKLRLKDVHTKDLTNDFICEICGNMYRQKHRLMEHMRIHNKEKTHECEICKKAFSKSEGLRRHILTHGGQRPFKCTRCTRCFYNPSARRAHEKVHDGMKPYICRICTKAFAYSCALRKHMLIHENRKLYQCDYCNKEFRLQHHLKQHEETQIHKDAVAETVTTTLGTDTTMVEE